ncbi:reverse transcriptase domain-containing protein [Tanacetum coccineum]
MQSKNVQLVGNLNDQIIVPVPDSSLHCAVCGTPVDGPYCHGIEFLEETTNLRNEITNFRQIAQESFSEAWERFKELLRKCHHHGFSLMHQLDTFYNSLSYNDQDSLNSAAGGNFLYKSPTEGLQIIENKAKVRCSRNAVMRVSTNAPPSSSSSNFEFQQMAAAFVKPKNLHKSKMTKMPLMKEKCIKA